MTTAQYITNLLTEYFEMKKNGGNKSEPDKDGRTYKIFDEDTVNYLETKEKTVSDTIPYCGDL